MCALLRSSGGNRPVGVRRWGDRCHTNEARTLLLPLIGRSHFSFLSINQALPQADQTLRPKPEAKQKEIVIELFADHAAADDPRRVVASCPL